LTLFDMRGYALLCPALLGHALLLALLCSALFSFDMPSHARICCAMSGYASIGDAKQS
jgi:hypothetical protein